MDRTALLEALDGLEADAVLHEMTALKKIPTFHRDMARTDALREVGTANLLAAARSVGARRFVTQSFFMGYGYGDWGERVLTEDDPFAPPGRGAFERGRPGEAYNVADDEPVSWGEFFGAVSKAFGAPQPREIPRWVFRFMPYARAMLMGDHRLSNAKAKRELGWTPSAPTYREGISRLVEVLGDEG
jgi:nucleoside-diphosphate-sugar epimerase